ncbi:hypothetical protein M407DRAFT_30280 [Tulasnella calospora MUT 4182]|uniref:CFEM domain-containing protein n=1 Tax=Tulasnella calospora MUT 4182 TaxID=1051891 RepID=A0A0C3LF25_9AGAM|nr:hypothetical protein M407DRAFT_30280 [Tulasnella calospora MUT 4182]
MRFSLVVLFAASLVSASSVFKRWNDDYGVPSCAKPCVANVDPWPCSRDDKACICINSNYGAQLDECIEGACSPEDVKAATEAGKKYCKAAGIDPENPFPKCGVHCFENAPTSNCYQDDNKCLCEEKDFLESFVWCFKDSCKGEDLKTAKCVGEAWCRAAGVDISSIFGS